MSLGYVLYSPRCIYSVGTRMACTTMCVGSIRVYIHIQRGAFGVARFDIRAIPEPLTVKRATVQGFTFFFYMGLCKHKYTSQL